MLRAAPRSPEELIGILVTRSVEEWVRGSARRASLTQSAPAWESVDGLSAHFDGSSASVLF